jgi:hypothetical protein
MIRVFACDVGGRDNFGWARIPNAAGQMLPQGNDSINSCIAALNADLVAGWSVAMGIESPLFLPVPSGAGGLNHGRDGEGNRSCLAPAGGFVTTIGLHQLAYIAQNVALGGAGWTSDHAAWAVAQEPRPLLLWEAFVSGVAHHSDAVHDAATAAFEFWNRLQHLPLATDVTVNAPRTLLSTAGAAALWAGWTDDPAVLHQSLLVVRPAHPYAGPIGVHP